MILTAVATEIAPRGSFPKIHRVADYCCNDIDFEVSSIIMYRMKTGFAWMHWRRDLKQTATVMGWYCVFQTDNQHWYTSNDGATSSTRDDKTGAWAKESTRSESLISELIGIVFNSVYFWLVRILNVQIIDIIFYIKICSVLSNNSLVWNIILCICHNGIFIKKSCRTGLTPYSSPRSFENLVVLCLVTKQAFFSRRTFSHGAWFIIQQRNIHSEN